MAATPLTDLAGRLLANVDANRGDYAPSMMTVPADEYRDTARFARPLGRELETDSSYSLQCGSTGCGGLASDTNSLGD